MFRYIVRIVAIACIAYSLFVIGKYVYSYEQVEKDTKSIVDKYTNESLRELMMTYEQMVGWITIPNTRLQQPIVQTTNNEFYLSHNYKGEQARTGAIFMDFRNDPYFQDQHTILYGHVLRTGAMFGDLPKYEDEQYAQAHQMIELEIAEETLILQVVSAYETTVEDPYLVTEFSTGEFLSYVEAIQKKSAWASNVAVTEADQLITLSTCTTSLNDDERFVVHAKIVERIEKK